MGRFEEFTYLINEIIKYWQKIAQKELKTYGLKSSHALYLTSLYKNPEGLSASELSDRLGRDKADVSRMTNILVDKGVLVKKSKNKKKYGGIFYLTDKGNKLASKISSLTDEYVDLASKNLSVDVRNMMYQALESINKNLQFAYKDLGVKNVNKTNNWLNCKY